MMVSTRVTAAVANRTARPDFCNIVSCAAVDRRVESAPVNASGGVGESSERYASNPAAIKSRTLFPPSASATLGRSTVGPSPNATRSE